MCFSLGIAAIIKRTMKYPELPSPHTENHSDTQQMHDCAGNNESQKIRVLWLTKALGYGGVERLLEHMSKVINHAKFTVECAFANPNYAELVPSLEKQGVCIHWLSRRGGNMVWPFRLFYVLRAGRYDVVHSHSPLLASLARLFILTMPKARRPLLVTTDHSFWYYYPKMTRLLNAATANLDNFNIAVSSAVKRSIPGRVGKKAIIQIQGIELAPLWELRAKAADKKRSDADTLHIVTVANFTPPKDYPTLFRACRILNDRGINYRLRIIGGWFDAKNKTRILALCDELELSPYMEFCGFREDASQLVVSSDIFVIASAFDAGPITAMEAAALGLPIVSTRVGIMNDAFTNGEDCLLVPTRRPDALAEAIIRLANDETMRKKLSECAFQRSAQFDIGRVVRSLEELYSSHQNQNQNNLRCL